MFDPAESDELNINMVPTGGTRKYIYSFATDRVGSFTIPPISFSFFEPSSKKYKEVSSDSLKFEIVTASENKNIASERKVISNEKSWLVFLLIMILLATVTVIFWRRKSLGNIQPSPGEKISYIQKLDGIISQQLTDKQFCSEIRKLLTEVNKEYNLSREQQQELQSLRNDCELLIYSDINSESKKEELQKRAETFLIQVQS